MSITDAVPLPPGWRRVPLGRLVDRRKDTGQPEAAPLSVFLDAGVVPRSSRVDNHNELGEDLAKYLVVRRKDLVFNKLRTWQGGFGASRFDGIVSPAYFVCRPTDELDTRFADYQLHSRPYLAELTRISKWQPPSQFDTPWEHLRAIDLVLPPVREQSAIAEFLDRECARIVALEAEIADYKRRLLDPALETFRRLTDGMPRGRIGYCFEVQLGKMLDEKRIDQENVSSYVRNANVHWDRLVLDDVKRMTFSTLEKFKFRLEPGDLLVCEGGEPGRAAVWNGELNDCYFQKALHRIRPRTDGSVRFLLWCLRDLSAREAFKGDGPGRYAHLTAEQLRAVRVPLPDAESQRRVAAQVDSQASAARAIGNGLDVLAGLLREYREALLTAAVTGELDFGRPSERQMEESVGALVELAESKLLST